jgi:hypothetical protein
MPLASNGDSTATATSEAGESYDQGICIDEDCVIVLNLCKERLDSFSIRHSEIKNEEFNTALSKVRSLFSYSEPREYCTRLLLRAKKILWDSKPNYLYDYKYYWDLCGNVLGRLASRGDRAVPAINVSGIISEIQNRFDDNQKHFWQVRKSVLSCYEEFIIRCIPSIAQTSGKNYIDTLNFIYHCSAYFDSALDCFGPLRLHKDVKLAAHTFVDLWWRLNYSLRLETLLPAATSDMNIFSKTTELAQGILPFIIKIADDKNDYLEKWHEGVGQLIAYINEPSKGDDDKKEIDRLCGNIINTVKYNLEDFINHVVNYKGNDTYRKLIILRNSIIPELQFRGYRRNRKIFNRNCTLIFKHPITGLEIKLNGSINNICQMSYCGFMIETEKLILNQIWTHDNGLRKDRLIDKRWPCYRIECIYQETGERLSIEEFDISFEWGTVNRSFHCLISRAWPIKDRGNVGGFALRADEKDYTNSIEWEKYVRGLESQV